LRDVNSPRSLGAPKQSGAQGALIAGVLQAFRAALIGFIPISLVTLIAWAAGGSGNGKSADAIHGAGWIWLAAHHVGFTLRLPPGDIAGRLWLLPIGLLIIPWFVLRDSGRRISASLAERDRRLALAALSITYAATLTLAAEMLTTKAVAPVIWVTPIFGFLAALIFGAIGVYGLRNLLLPLNRRLSYLAKSIVRGIVTTSLILYGASALLLLAATIRHWSRLMSLFTVLNPGWAGMVLLVVLILATFPNAVVMTACLLSGAGFSLGNQTLISPLHVQIGELPAFPLLAALPTGRSLFLTLLPAVTLVASAVGGFIAVKSETHLLAKFRGSALHALVNLGILLALNVLAGGALLGGQLSSMGASYLRILLFAGPLLLIGSALGGLISLFSSSSEGAKFEH
jgi:hypothetical protein